MTEDEPPPVLSLPSTSTCPPRELEFTSPRRSESSTSSSSLPGSPTNFSTILTLNFDRLSLEPELKEGRYDRKETNVGPLAIIKLTRTTTTEDTASEKMPSIVKKAHFYRIPAHRKGRFLPYGVPFKLRRRRKRAMSISTIPANLDVLLKIKLKGDVEPLKMCIFDKEKLASSSKPCSVQAAQPPSPGAEEVDELSEYFTHFVRVDLKMSSLAESMYV